MYTKGFLEDAEDHTDGVERQIGSHVGEVADRHLIPTLYHSQLPAGDATQPALLVD